VTVQKRSGLCNQQLPSSDRKSHDDKDFIQSSATASNRTILDWVDYLGTYKAPVNVPVILQELLSFSAAGTPWTNENSNSQNLTQNSKAFSLSSMYR
jgi:hypothetical protein